MKKVCALILICLLTTSLVFSKAIAKGMVNANNMIKLGVTGGGGHSRFIDETPFVDDTFTESSLTDLKDHTGEVGATWTYHPNYNSVGGDYIAIDATNDSLYAYSGLRMAYASGTPSSANYTVIGQFFEKNDADLRVWIVGRANTSSSDWYGIQVDQNDDTVTLMKNVGGSLSALGSPASFNPSDGDTFYVKLVMNGTTISGYYKGASDPNYVQIASVTDSSHSSAGRSGVFMRTAGTNNGPQLTRITATESNDSVTANAGADRSVADGRSVSLSASGSSGSGGETITTYSWTQTSGTAVTINNANTATPSFTSPTLATDNTTLVFQVQVTGSLGSISTDSVTIWVVNTNASDVVQISDPKVALIVGPQLLQGSSPYSLFENWLNTTSLTMADAFPAIPPRVQTDYGLPGFVSVNNGSAAVVGSGTDFVKYVSMGPAPYYNGHLRIRDSGGTYREVEVASITDATHLTLTANWSFGNVSGALADTYDSDTGNTDFYINQNYYDFGLVLYCQYYRTGNPAFLTAARKVTDSWWQSAIAEGTRTDAYTPRNSSLGGLMLRALDGRPEMFDWLYRFTTGQFQIWVKNHVSSSVLVNGVRDGGFMLLYETWLSYVLPNTYTLYGNGTQNASTGTASDGATKRTSMLADAEDAAVNYYGRLQHRGDSIDGAWTWDDFDFGPNPPTDKLEDIEQPFMIGLLLQALTDLRRHPSTSTSTKSDLQTSITKSVGDLGTWFRNNHPSDQQTKLWRCYWEFIHGGITSNATLYASGGGYGTGDWSNAALAPSAVGADPNLTINSARDINALIVHGFGYAYLITSTTSYKTQGDDQFEAAFGGADGYQATCAQGPKQFNQCFRTSTRYVAYRTGDL